MGKIEEALNEFGLGSNFTISELERKYALKKKVVPIDFKKGEVNIYKKDMVDYNYQILVIYNKLKTLTKDVDIENRGINNVQNRVLTFYKEDNNNHSSIIQLFEFLKLDFTNFDIDIEKAKTKEDLQKALDNLISAVKNDCAKFISDVLDIKTGNRRLSFIKEIIFENSISIKDVIVRTYNFATGNEKLVIDDFKERLEVFEHNSLEYHKGMGYFASMYRAKSYTEAEEIYKDAVYELFSPKESKISK